MFAADLPELAVARGHWLRRGLIAWPADDLPAGVDPAELDWVLHWSMSEPIDPREPEPVPWGTAVLRPLSDGLPDQVARTVPHLRGHLALHVPDWVPVEEALCGQLAVSAHEPSGRLVLAGALQLPGVLDEVYAAAADATLGVDWRRDVPTLRVWAPTAQRVRLLLWGADDSLDEPPQALPMTRRPDGVWELTGAVSWRGARYRFEVTVFVGEYGRVVSNQVTDPYSVALTVNSTHSVLADLTDPAFAPALWAGTPSPPLAHPVDQVIYELHVRDFSVSDATVPKELRGSFAAFGADSNGMAHLRRLAQAGLTCVQLLPVFDNASVEERPDQRERPAKRELRAFPANSPEQQARITQAASAYNWGYDPWHYFAPEGSYAATLASADGPGRIAEFRTMVGSLHAIGLRVVLDMVFNHTASAGQDSHSVLDRIVPGYYHRLTGCGEVETSTCCPNVATEHLMAQKLMVDACVSWARHYRVDGFRFDLMAHHSRDNLLAVRAGLDALTVAADGVDGRAITLYGEGWNFGEVADNARFVQASQGQLGGTSIATFSDRLRDAVRGSGFGDPRIQGFGTGLVTADNGHVPEWNRTGSGERLASDTDLVQLGLAGTLRSYRFRANSLRRDVRGDELDYHGRQAGYADQPDEVISYVDAHDNETLFDALILKLPVDTPMRDRVRLNTVCLALATLGQSPVLWHAGTDLLRSKSLDRNSYSSGDWFNFLDFSMTDNGFAAGLPPERDNGPNWDILRPLLANPALKPAPEDIRFAHAMALDLLRLRASTPLFRLRTAAAIEAAVSFPVSGTGQQLPGVAVMAIDGTLSQDGSRLSRSVTPRGTVPQLDQGFERVVVVFNPTPGTVRQAVPFGTDGMTLHPVQAAGIDEVVRQAVVEQAGFVVPARTVAVFVQTR
ncbi:MAG: pullulanase-type alpha-1,6-glucosidase [Propionicimonas sp.]|uniref:pullulanase-type alpha-1,6-glucosidase n=1 Tax=Propionicimonas sp. TaxID=1955623 RepID=UPI002B1F1ACB|nr:pullulanase-type alpha-1,6-glucosidase [Propionicimonas sp.]MEA4943516.1 pullulanase-type alpha-1,6-glucosidase [Propionicimonas sp.]